MDIKVKARVGVFGDIEVLLFSNDGQQRFIADPIPAFTMRPVQQGLPHEPTMVLSREIAEEIVRAIMEEGIKPDHVSVAEGKLEAMEYHLEDLRTMLKLKPRPTVTITTSKQ